MLGPPPRRPWEEGREVGVHQEGQGGPRQRSRAQKRGSDMAACLHGRGWKPWGHVGSGGQLLLYSVCPPWPCSVPRFRRTRKLLPDSVSDKCGSSSRRPRRPPHPKLQPGIRTASPCRSQPGCITNTTGWAAPHRHCLPHSRGCI